MYYRLKSSITTKGKEGIEIYKKFKNEKFKEADICNNRILFYVYDDKKMLSYLYAVPSEDLEKVYEKGDIVYVNDKNQDTQKFEVISHYKDNIYLVFNVITKYAKMIDTDDIC